ncbi:juvenile hormone epoxide hydrolase 1-like isoform X1 [Hermetia illucens]|uniref:juvenile hormone epoxide hydrolase 1-like isoform X1 n=1 Tax=Hermetia illucens TaxID=343691 RepID=UPI0018CC37F3|nr:juvenile hormone epoxide hydrolase 1-like isoform X1 [Hermetia illucens]
MGFLCRVTLAVFVVFIAFSAYKFRELTKPIEAPKFDLDEYWGPGKKSDYKENTEVVKYEISFPDKVIQALRKDLNRTFEFQPPLEGVGFEYGFNTAYLPKVIKYWRDEYLPKWRTRELFLRKWPHFTTNIQGLRIHYIHNRYEQPPKGKKVFPLLLLHGWPGSVREFYDMIPLLVDNAKSKYAFEIVIPSLPGYGWSQAAAKPGLGVAEIAVIFRNLMFRLGYKKFFIQGGDWGSVIGSNIATLFPEAVLGYHSNLCWVKSPLSIIKYTIASYYPKHFVPEGYEDFFFPQSEKFKYLIEESGYFHIQATKPDTIGAALTNNPVGLVAYILEKFPTWTNKDYRKLSDGGLEERFTLEALLDNIMIYYLTNSITTSQRLYSESFSLRELALQLDRVQTNVPTGCARFKHDVAHDLNWVLRDKYTNLIHSTYHNDGGHFAAFELPEVLYKDFIEFVEKVVKLDNL